MKIIAVILVVIAVVLLVAEFIHNEYEIMNKVERKMKFTAQEMVMEFIWAVIFVVIMILLVLNLEEDYGNPLCILIYVMCYVVSSVAIIFSVKNHNRYRWEAIFKNEYIHRIYDNRKFVYEEIQLVCISGMDRLGNYIISVYIDNKKYCLNVSPKEYEQLKRRLDGEVLTMSERLDNSADKEEKIMAGIWMAVILGFVVFICLWILDFISGNFPQMVLIAFIIAICVLAFVSYIQNDKKEKEILKSIQEKK